ncbi:hypothetical protein GCM10023331_41170 [Algivirga pacifica]|uniref:Uncharacterized protein n=1 Tax=Algivirga pacifica TaxID=1162670 RepID=A0ABP9DP71_9BACT
MLTPYQFASNEPIAGIDLDGLERVHYALINYTNEGVPVFKVLGKETVRTATIETILSPLGDWADINIDFPIEKSIVIWAQVEGPKTPTGFVFKTWEEAVYHAENGFQQLDPYNDHTVSKERNFQYAYNKSSQIIGLAGEALANINLSHSLSGKRFFDKYDDGTVFSGVYNHKTRAMELRPSFDGPKKAVPEGWVPRTQGHGKILRQMEVNRKEFGENYVGFTVKLVDGNNMKVISWRSRSVNGRYHEGNEYKAQEFNKDISTTLEKKYNVTVTEE